MSSNESQIRQFFKKQTIFLTGGSSFIGKVLIEKLLRICDDLEKIYVLLRPKKEESPEKRLEEFFNYPCFDLLKSQNKNFLEKFYPIFGDCQKPDLGLSDQDSRTLVKETTCVIHAAANGRFDQTLKEATYGVRATKDLLELAKHMANLKVFVFISTAFSHCIDASMGEKFYGPPIKPENLMTVVDSFDDHTLEAITPQLLGSYPNAYVYGKIVTEELIKAAGEYLPITMIRPAIVASTASEPMPGWIENFSGAPGIAAGSCLGVIRSFHGKPDAPAPLVPVDYVCNCILAAAWKREDHGTTTIYNFAPEKTNQISWRELMNYMNKYRWLSVSEKILWYGTFEMRESKIWHKMCVFFSLVIPAYIADLVLYCSGKPAIAVKNCQRLNRELDSISYFCMKKWNFDYTNVKELWNEINDVDKKLFCFNMSDINWSVYFRDACINSRVYIMKESWDTFSRAQKKVTILFIAHYSILAIFYYLLYKIIMLALGLFV